MEQPADYKSVKTFKETHTEIKYRFKDNMVILSASNGDSIVATIPYANGFCMHPVKCAGHSSCPRNRACSE